MNRHISVEIVLASLAAAAGADEFKIDSQNIPVWIADLGDPSYPRREIATRKLLEAGRPAIYALASAAESKNAEIAWRAREILVGLAVSLNKETRRKVAEGLNNNPRLRDEITPVAKSLRGENISAEVRRRIDFFNALRAGAIRDGGPISVPAGSSGPFPSPSSDDGESSSDSGFIGKVRIEFVPELDLIIK